ncbi:Lnb N-terminal periplasmic domain-containing protein [Desulfonema magnum]|uniref:Lnb N-terminal periplasmic domain-containing protein n=1 Tax=Desulfonema magnum TaxID=45655 RepID=UPI001A9B1FAD|nr:DUF4105 domain-containing protein [Desulfonema magnum]
MKLETGNWKLETGNSSLSYADRLIELARQKKLHEQKYWRILLHYKKTLSGVESTIDDPRFFLAPDGKFNPKSELEATVRAFFREKRMYDPADIVSDPKDTDHPVCRFVARYSWLKEKLDIDESELPVAECEEFNRIVREISPKSASIVFPTYYMNSPASMFGHTLICIGTDYKNKLLSHAVNYSALADETNGFLFVTKGLFGFYKGYYSTLPYYQKIQEYSDISQRDIWEYELDMTESEVKQMIMHLWELRGIYTEYYFFDENCSYNLLFLLEAARPSLDLTGQFPAWVLPIDTIKAMKKQGLFRDVDYRPSQATKIKYKISLLSESSRKIVLDIINKKMPPESVFGLDIRKDEQIRITDLAADHIRYQYARKKISKKDYQNFLLNTLKVRSKLGMRDKGLYNVPLPPRPDNVHESKKLSLGLGSRQGDFFQEVAYRPVFSNLLDTDYGYEEGIQIEFFSGKLRYYSSDKKFELVSLNVIDIISVSPMSRFFRPYSWKVNTGLKQKTMSDGEESLICNLNTGGGLAFYDDNIGLYYLFIEPELNVGGDLEDSYALGLGLSAGVLKRISDSWKCHLSARTMCFEFGDKHRSHDVSLSQRIRLNRNNSISLNLSWEESFDSSHTEAGLYWNLFF